jgi:hypothetical protein
MSAVLTWFVELALALCNLYNAGIRALNHWIVPSDEKVYIFVTDPAKVF